MHTHNTTHMDFDMDMVVQYCATSAHIVHVVRAFGILCSVYRLLHIWSPLTLGFSKCENMEGNGDDDDADSKRKWAENKNWTARVCVVCLCTYTLCWHCWLCDVCVCVCACLFWIQLNWSDKRKSWMHQSIRGTMHGVGSNKHCSQIDLNSCAALHKEWRRDGSWEGEVMLSLTKY